MKAEKKQASSVDEYIDGFPPAVGAKLQEMRALIRAAAPKAVERISYRMPAYDLNGILVYFAAFENHIGFYPTSSGISAFQDELKKYKSGKGSVRFPLDRPLPRTLIKKIVKFRVKENSTT